MVRAGRGGHVPDADHRTVPGTGQRDAETVSNRGPVQGDLIGTVVQIGTVVRISTVVEQVSRRGRGLDDVTDHDVALDGAEHRDAEERVARVIELWAGLPHGATSWRLVREADELLLMTEKRDLMAEAPAPWTFAQGVPATPLPEAIQPWTWQVAEWEFRALFERLWKVDAPRPDHFHSCPYCYVKHPCGMACTIEGDLSDDGVDFGAHHACEACERAGADVDDATEAFQ